MFSIINTYEANDKRKDISIGIAEGAYDAFILLLLRCDRAPQKLVTKNLLII